MTKITDQHFANLRYQIYNYAYKITRNADDSEDIVQTAFYKLYIQEKQIENPKAWLFRVVYNLSVNLIKKKQKAKSLDELKEKIGYEIPDFDNTEDKKEYEIPFEQLKTQLSKQDLKIYKYFFVKQLSPSDIAKKMKIKLKTSQKYVQRMKRNLKAAIFKEQGLTWTKNILTYQQYENIGNFIKLLIKKTRENDLASLKSYFQNFSLEEMPEVNIVEIRDWGIRLKNPEYKMVLFCVTRENEINFLDIEFFINKLNRLKITNIKKANFVKLSDSKKIKAEIKDSKIQKSFKELKKIADEQKKRLQ